MAPFAFHDDLRPRHCHACPDAHPNDVISFRLALPDVRAPGADLRPMLAPPLYQGVSQWWSTTSYVGERRNFVRGLVS